MMDAANMRGKFNGLKSLMLRENPSAWYVHCFAHQLQSVIVVVSKINRYTCDFFCYTFYDCEYMWIILQKVR